MGLRMSRVGWEWECMCCLMSCLLSVYTDEMMAVIIGLQWVEEVLPDRVVLCVDSVSALLSIRSRESARPDLVLEIQLSLYRLRNIGKRVEFCWVPAHVGVRGNEDAD